MSMSYKEQKAKIENIVNSPLREFKPEALKAIIERFYKNHKKSKEAYERAKKIIPGGVEHNLAFNFPFPLASKKVYDCWMETVDDVKLLDYLMCGGPIILGHNYPPLIEKMVEIIQEIGPCHGITHEYEYLSAELIQKHYPSCKIIRWLQSGSEADMLAIRVARTFTNRKWIIKVGGSYHGWTDQLVYDMHVPGTKLLESHGIPKEVFSWIDSVPPNDIDTLRQMFKEKKKVAAVILEPMGGESGANPVRPEFNKEVEELCHENDTLLISDEVVAAFRLHMGGGQAYFGYTPDLSVFGKIISHGFPSAGAIGGREDVMSVCAAGVQGGKRAYCGGTIAANPISCGAGYYALKMIEETKAVEKAGKAATRLAKGFNNVFEENELPWFSYNYGATVHMHTACIFGFNMNDPKQVGEVPKRKEFMGQMGAALVDQELISVAGSRFYTCMQHTDELVDKTVEKIGKICQMVK